MAPPATLERAILDVLWDAPRGLTAREVAEALPGRRRAVTTVLTVLDRLRRKSLVSRETGTAAGAAATWRASRSRERLAAEAMLDVLAGEPDRAAALARFVQDVPPSDLAALQDALRQRDAGGPEGTGTGRPG